MRFVGALLLMTMLVAGACGDAETLPQAETSLTSNTSSPADTSSPPDTVSSPLSGPECSTQFTESVENDFDEEAPGFAESPVDALNAFLRSLGAAADSPTGEYGAATYTVYKQFGLVTRFVGQDASESLVGVVDVMELPDVEVFAVGSAYFCVGDASIEESPPEVSQEPLDE